MCPKYIPMNTVCCQVRFFAQRSNITSNMFRNTAERGKIHFFIPYSCPVVFTIATVLNVDPRFKKRGPGIGIRKVGVLRRMSPCLSSLPALGISTCLWRSTDHQIGYLCLLLTLCANRDLVLVVGAELLTLAYQGSIRGS